MLFLFFRVTPTMAATIIIKNHTTLITTGNTTAVTIILNDTEMIILSHTFEDECPGQLLQ